MVNREKSLYCIQISKTINESIFHQVFYGDMMYNSIFTVLETIRRVLVTGILVIVDQGSIN